MNRNFSGFLKGFALILLVLLSTAASLWSAGMKEDTELTPGVYAEFETNRGNLIFRLDYERAPLTVTNFCGLAEGTLPNTVKAENNGYYDGLEFYRNAKNYAIFSGDPNSDGSGGPGYTIPREFGVLYTTASPGALVMDGTVSESAGSRFFIMRNGDAYLDEKYTAFGLLVNGERSLKQLSEGDRIENVNILRIGEQASKLVFNEELFDKHNYEARLAELERLRRISPLLANAVLDLGRNRQKTASGIYYSVTGEGKGTKPLPGSQISMNYEGRLLDGTIFDSTLNRNQTFDFLLGVDGVIPGWVEMVIDMQAGEKRRVIIPPGLAYGEQGFGPIPPSSWLIFDMELVSFSKK